MENLAGANMFRQRSLSDFLSDLWAHVRVSLYVSCGADEQGGRPVEPAGRNQQSVLVTQVGASMPPGRIMRNGLGSLEIGAVRNRIDE